MKWRLNSWPQKHFSIVIIDLREHEEYTSLILHQYGVPSEVIERIEEDWNKFYWKTISEKFGHELKINTLSN
jgi:activator of HSP90 ATPase